MSREQGGTIAAIQLLRALAAVTVAAGHIAFAFADHVGSGLGLSFDADASGQIAVMLFFIVSGYVMVVAAERQFGKQGARGLFWRRRFIRIMPPYWLATGMLAAVFLTLFPTPIDAGKLLKSLALIPYWPDTGYLRPMPFLWVGWTLLYEMLFYLCFGLFIGWPRGRALMAVFGVLAALVIAGTFVPPVNPLLFVITRPVLLVFGAGMALAAWRASGARLAPGLRWLLLGASVAVMALVPEPPMSSALGWGYLAWAGLPALLMALAVLGGPLALPAAGLINRAGDMSYGVYLLHVPIAWVWLWLWHRLPWVETGPWDYLVTALFMTLAASWAFHRGIERPMTLALNRRLAAPHIGKEPHRKTA